MLVCLPDFWEWPFRNCRGVLYIDFRKTLWTICNHWWFHNTRQLSMVVAPANSNRFVAILRPTPLSTTQAKF